jgi:hypothetical protein
MAEVKNCLELIMKNNSDHSKLVQEIEKIKKARQTIERSNDALSVLILILLQRVVLLSDEKALKI